MTPLPTILICSYTDNILSPILVNILLQKFDTSSKKNENDKNTNILMKNKKKMTRK